MAIVDKDLASGLTQIGSFSPTPLHAGDADIVTEEATVAAGAGTLAKYTVMGRVTATGKLVKHNPAAVDGSQNAVAILTQGLTAGAADVAVAVYTAGFFNHAALTWDAGVATLAARQAAFRATTGHQIRIGSVRL